MTLLVKIWSSLSSTKKSFQSSRVKLQLTKKCFILWNLLKPKWKGQN